MKNLVIIFAMVLGSLNLFAQNDNQVVVGYTPCLYCNGCGGTYHPYFGPIRCQFCGGRGCFPIYRPVSNYLPSGPSFSATYTGTNHTVHVKCTTGADKGYFKVYLHNGDMYIQFSNSWIKLGNGRFSYNGNSYVFTFC